MKRALFILQLFCLLISNFNYSTEDLTKKVGESITKQTILTFGAFAVAAWSHRTTIIRATEAIMNQWSHKKTQNKVDATQNFLKSELEPAIQLGFKNINNHIDQNHNIYYPLLADIDTTTKALKPEIEFIKADTIDSKTKINTLLDKNTEIINNYLSPIKADTEIIKQTTNESLALNKEMRRDIRDIKAFFNIVDKNNN